MVLNYSILFSTTIQQQKVVQRTQTTWHHELWTVIPTRMPQVVLTPVIGVVSQRRGFVLTLEKFTVSSLSNSGTGVTVGFTFFFHKKVQYLAWFFLVKFLPLRCSKVKKDAQPNQWNLMKIYFELYLSLEIKSTNSKALAR